MNYIEKRKIERFDLELPALLSMKDEGGNQRPAEFMTRNICSGGAFFKTHDPLPVGTELKMDLIIPLDKFNITGARKSRIDLSGSVIRVGKHGMAVCFDKRYRIIPQ